jgi:FAD/FMN-containing dehydrogenase
MDAEATGHAARRAALAAQLRARATDGAAPLGLGKRSSNLFRDRHEGAKRRLDLSDFCHVLAINTAEGWVDVEGLTSYETLVAQTLPHGVMPAVVPQLKTITVGGAAAGVGIEATSHRWGLVHDTLLEFDVLLPDGTIVNCRPDNAQRDLFFGFPNSYGTLGYALRLRLRTLPTKPYVKVAHLPHADPAAFFNALEAACQSEADFVDGVVFGPRQQVLNTACFVDEAPWLSDYSDRHIYYRSLPDKPVDYLRVQDYLWRWDTDWFWCSKNVYAQNSLVRRLLGPSRLNSRTYTRIMRWNARWGITRRLARLRGLHTESVIQDVDIPMAQAPQFLAFLLREIGILPIWVCPVRAPLPQAPFTLFPLTPGTRYVNFGFWDVVQSREPHPAGHFNRLVEREVIRLGGIKSLYSESYFTPEEFGQAYAMAQYQTLKAKYDPAGRMLGLYEKCVLRA